MEKNGAIIRRTDFSMFFKKIMHIFCVHVGNSKRLFVTRKTGFNQHTPYIQPDPNLKLKLSLCVYSLKFPQNCKSMTKNFAPTLLNKVH